MTIRLLLAFFTLSLMRPIFAQETPMTPVTIPAYDAYSEPDGEAVTFEENAPATNWKDKKQSVVWYGDLAHTGAMHCAVTLRLTPGETVTLHLTLTGRAAPDAKETRLPGGDATIKGAAGDVVADFGEVQIPHTGYWRFALRGTRKSGMTFGAPVALTISGAAAQEAKVNRSKWRSPASVHLGYPLPPDFKAIAAYAEVTATADPIHTYYCALGFRRGYFGMQINSAKERRIIFSVWDSGNEAVARSKVAAEDRVQLLAKGDGVYTDSFGNEGTGGHSHLVYSWKTNQPQKFMVTAKPDGTHTIYSGYFFFPETKRWGLIASYRAPRDGAYLSGLYSFSEVFGADYGQQSRRAEFSRQWAQSAGGAWTELLTARFTHTARNEPLVRPDWGGGVLGDRFYLANGGFRPERLTYGDILTRAPSKEGSPKAIVLPAISLNP